MVSYTIEQIVSLITKSYLNRKIIILAPIIKARKGHYRDLFNQILKQGFIKARIDGEIQNITPGLKLDRYKSHDIEIVIVRVELIVKNNKRLKDSIIVALKLSTKSSYLISIWFKLKFNKYVSHSFIVLL